MGATEEAAVDAALRPHARPVTRVEPVVATRPLRPTASRIGGDPFLRAGEPWPSCVCHQPLSFIAQLDVRGTALAVDRPFDLGVFYFCWDCFPQDGPPGPWVLRTYDDPRDDDAAAVTYPDVRRIAPHAVTLTGGASLPVWESNDDAMPEIRALCRAANDDAPWEAFNAACERVAGPQDLTTAIGGHPHWLQGDETPPASRFLFTIDSEADFSWGDCGSVYIFLTADGPTLVLQSL